jgi:hypothetical protein
MKILAQLQRSPSGRGQASKRRGAERFFENVFIISFLRASAPLRDINQLSFSYK